jgi:hypothetical protein
MENNQKTDKPTTDAMKGYNPTDRDFQRTEPETDSIDQSEVDVNKEEANKNTERANTTPNKNRME